MELRELKPSTAGTLDVHVEANVTRWLWWIGWAYRIGRVFRYHPSHATVLRVTAWVMRRCDVTVGPAKGA